MRYPSSSRTRPVASEGGIEAKETETRKVGARRPRPVRLFKIYFPGTAWFFWRITRPESFTRPEIVTDAVMSIYFENGPAHWSRQYAAKIDAACNGVGVLLSGARLNAAAKALMLAMCIRFCRPFTIREIKDAGSVLDLRIKSLGLQSRDFNWRFNSLLKFSIPLQQTQKAITAQQLFLWLK